MTCSACSTRVEKSVAKLPGIKEVSVNLLKNSMVASYDESVLDTAGIVQAVEKAGYGAIPKASAQNKSRTTTPAAKPEVSTAQAEYKQMKQRLLLSALFTIPLFYISMGHMMGWPLPSSLLGMENAISFAFTQFLLLIPVVFINFKYYRMGFKTLFHGSPKALRDIQGIKDVAVHLESKSAQVQLDQDVPDAVLKAAIEDAGYQLVSIQ